VFYAKFDDSDEFLKRNIGNAISVMLATAIDTSVLNHVKAWMTNNINQIPKQLDYISNHKTLERAITNLCDPKVISTYYTY